MRWFIEPRMYRLFPTLSSTLSSCMSWHIWIDQYLANKRFHDHSILDMMNLLGSCLNVPMFSYKMVLGSENHVANSAQKVEEEDSKNIQSMLNFGQYRPGISWNVQVLCKTNSFNTHEGNLQYSGCWEEFDAADEDLEGWIPLVLLFLSSDAYFPLFYPLIEPILQLTSPTCFSGQLWSATYS